jgi:putative FmdB family regulatory protein
MPTFDYKCEKCGNSKEVFGVSHKHTEKCDCGNQMKKLWGAPPAHYKGSGFYTTDYKKRGR